jgi:hypothetical protein
MMKRIMRVNVVLLTTVFTLGLLTGCGKDNTPQPTTSGKQKDYKLYNLSTGASVEAGTFTISELLNGNAKLAIQLNPNYKVTGARFKVTMTVPQTGGTELLFADLGEMDGGSGTMEINPLLAGATNAAVTYNDIIGRTGYTLKIMNGANLQARGTIQ